MLGAIAIVLAGSGVRGDHGAPAGRGRPLQPSATPYSC